MFSGHPVDYHLKNIGLVLKFPVCSRDLHILGELVVVKPTIKCYMVVCSIAVGRIQRTRHGVTYQALIISYNIIPSNSTYQSGVPQGAPFLYRSLSEDNECPVLKVKRTDQHFYRGGEKICHQPNGIIQRITLGCSFHSNAKAPYILNCTSIAD